jgi:hypothetical protein
MPFRTPGPPRAGATLSLFLLLLMPALLVLAFFAWNVRLVDQQRSAQETVTDACGLAAGQALIDDRMLHGTPAHLDDLEDLARQVARHYDGLNPLWPGSGPAAQLNFQDDDFRFTTSVNPLNPSLAMIDSIALTGRRTRAAGNPVPVLGGRLFAAPNVEVVTVSTALLDRRVAGLRPVFAKNIPLAPIAIANAAWTANAESASPPGTWTLTLRMPDACFLSIGADIETDLIDQLRNGISPPQLDDFGGQFVLDTVGGLDVPMLVGPDAKNLKTQLQELIGKPRVWPLFASSSGGTVSVKRLIAARIGAVADVVDPMTKAASGVSLTLQPCFFAAPAVVTEPGRDVNPYLCRVRLTNSATP